MVFIKKNKKSTKRIEFFLDAGVNSLELGFVCIFNVLFGWDLWEVPCRPMKTPAPSPRATPAPGMAAGRVFAFMGCVLCPPRRVRARLARAPRHRITPQAWVMQCF
jgi:hypothetical protein